MAGGLVSLRTLRLRLGDRWCYLEAGLVALITVQIAAALHYWPLSPVTFGLALLGPAYALTKFLGNLARANRRARQSSSRRLCWRSFGVWRLVVG